MLFFIFSVNQQNYTDESGQEEDIISWNKVFC